MPKSQFKIQAVLFDLDGTLLDTAPDLAGALNRLLIEHNLPPLSVASMRQIANYGSLAILKTVFGILDDKDEKFINLRQKFIAFYEENIADNTKFFPNMENVLLALESRKIAWGIVTNKLTRHTQSLLEILGVFHRPGCIVCGDTLPTYKPDPAPILHACQLLAQAPEHCLYVGDALIDVKASKAAGVRSLVALYGYIHSDENPLLWEADGYVNDPAEILEYL